jgi:hypothetical protein
MNIWRKFLAFATAFALSTSAMAGGTGPTVFEPFMWTNDGTQNNPSFSFANDVDTGMYHPATNQLSFSTNGVPRVGLTTARNTFTSDLLFGWTNSAVDPLATPDVLLARDAANTLAQRNSTNAQAFRVYNTYTDASNYERFSTSWAGNIVTLKTEAAGTGTEREVRFQAGVNGGVLKIDSAGAFTFGRQGVANYWFISAGNFIAGTDNTYDIGASGATRPRTGYFGTSVVAPQLRTTAFTVGTLPTCNAGNQGSRAHVTDALAPAFLTALVGGGAVVSPAFCDGKNWVAG